MASTVGHTHLEAETMAMDAQLIIILQIQQLTNQVSCDTTVLLENAISVKQQAALVVSAAWIVEIK